MKTKVVQSLPFAWKTWTEWSSRRQFWYCLSHKQAFPAVCGPQVLAVPCFVLCLPPVRDRGPSLQEDPQDGLQPSLKAPEGGEEGFQDHWTVLLQEGQELGPSHQLRPL